MFALSAIPFWFHPFLLVSFDLHPANVLYFLENCWNGEFEVLLIWNRIFAVLGVLINGFKRTVEDAHYEIIVVAWFAIGELGLGDVDKVVLKLIETVDFFHSLLKCFFYIIFTTWRILLYHIGQNLALNELIEFIDLIWAQLQSVGEFDDVCQLVSAQKILTFS